MFTYEVAVTEPTNLVTGTHVCNYRDMSALFFENAEQHGEQTCMPNIPLLPELPNVYGSQMITKDINPFSTMCKLLNRRHVWGEKEKKKITKQGIKKPSAEVPVEELGIGLDVTRSSNASPTQTQAPFALKE